MHIDINVEFKHSIDGPRMVQPGQVLDFKVPSPDGWTGISWGPLGFHPSLEIQTAGYAVGPEGRQAFIATVRNSGAVERPVRFLLLHLKA